MIGEWTLEGGDDYVKLLRKLEEQHKANPDSAAANFLLGYHYLVLGHLEQALELFEHSAKLEPTDTVSAGLRDLIRDSINVFGEVTFAEDSKLSFVLAGGPRGDPGLTFERQP